MNYNLDTCKETSLYYTAKILSVLWELVLRYIEVLL